MRLPPLPKQVDAPLGPVRVVLAPLGDDYGDFLEERREVRINETLSPMQRWVTLYHELTHAALSDCGVDEVITEEMAEAVCDAVSTARFRERFGNRAVNTE